MPLYNRVKEHRARLGINQTELGKLCNVSRQTISLIERGDYSPSVSLALKIAKVCKTTVEEIFSTLVPVSIIIGVGIGFFGSFTTVRKHIRV